jgi:hypothetical protein
MVPGLIAAAGGLTGWLDWQTRAIKSSDKTLREPMPFYLVIQTTLIEADDETEAARGAVDRIRSGGKVAVTVKSDETTALHLVVDAQPQNLPIAQKADRDTVAPIMAQDPRPADGAKADSKRKLTRMIADALTLVRWRN